MSHIMFALIILVMSCTSLRPLSAEAEKTPRIAVFNFKVNGQSSFESHIQRIDLIVQKAQQKNANFLLLPELMILDLLPQNPTEDEMKKHLDQLASMSSEYESELVRICKRWKMNLIGASIVIKEKSHYLNRAFFITDKGEVSYQDKVKPTPWELKHGFLGAKEIKLLKARDFSFAILICHDAEFPSLSHALAKHRPEVIFVPSQTDDQYGLNRVKFTSSARAIEHMAFVLMTGTSGAESAPWHSYVGQNFFFTPQNKYFEEGFMSGKSNEETLSVFSLELQKLRTARRDSKQVYPVRDQ